MNVDVVYETNNMPDGWHDALKIPGIRYIRYHFGFDANPEYVLKLKKGEKVSPMSYLPSDLTDDCYKVYLKRGDYVKAEVRLLKFGAKIPKNTDHIQILPLYIDTGKSPESLIMFKVVKEINELVVNNRFKQALDKMSKFPMTPDILHFTRKCHNLLNNREAVISANLDPKTIYRNWYHYDAMSQANFETSAACYYLGDFDSAFYHQDLLVRDRCVSRNLKHGYLRNICDFYKRQMIQRPEKIVKIYNQIHHPANYHLMNISLLKIEDDMPEWVRLEGTVAIGLARTVNYLIKNGAYVSMHEDRKIRTETYMIWLDSDLNVTAQCKLHVSIDYFKHRHTAIENFEDLRIFKYPDGQIGFTGTGIDTHVERSHQMIIGQIGIGGKIISITMLHYADWRSQKNWLAFTYNGELLMVYKYDPFTLIKVKDQDIGSTEIYVETPTKYDLDHIRGSSAPILVNSWLAGTKYSGCYWLMTVHSSVHLHNGRTAYLQKFILLSRNFEIKHLSRFFKMTTELVEYSMGCILLNDKIVISYSQDDRLGCLAVLTKDQVLDCFN